MMKGERKKLTRWLSGRLSGSKFVCSRESIASVSCRDPSIRPFISEMYGQRCIPQKDPKKNLKKRDKLTGFI